jgi:aryl-alcohol dehydrogenase-like predicted oxidoreductase
MVTNQHRNLGTEGLAASPLGLGCMGMSEFYGSPDESEAVRTIHRALELELTGEDLSELDGLADSVAGTRYGAEQMGAVGR